MSHSGRFGAGTGAPPIETLTGNSGGTVGPNGVGNIDFVGDGTVITVTGTPASNVLTITAAQATTTNLGVIELATDAETIAGTDTDRAVVPSSLAAKLGIQTQYALPYGNTTSGAIQWTSAGTNGQIPIAATGGAPAFATIISTGGTIDITNGANSIDIDVDETIADQYDTDLGSAVPAAGVLTVAGGTGISTSGAASTVTITLDTPVAVSDGGTGATSLTDHGVLLGSGTAAVTVSSVGTDGQILIGATGADPAFADLTSSGGTITITPGANTLNIDTDGSVAVQYDGDSGSAVPSLGVLTIAGGTGITTSAASSTVTIDLDIPVSVSDGGTGNTTFTAYSVICAGTTATGAFQNVSGVGTSGQLLTSNGAGALPTWQDAPITFTWNEETGTSSSMAVNNGYIANNAGLVTLTLPATAAVGDVVRVTGKGAGGWRIAQNAGQTIYFGTMATTTGATGMLDSTDDRDGIELVCVTANNDWNVLSSIGNITVT